VGVTLGEDDTLGGALSVGTAVIPTSGEAVTGTCGADVGIRVMVGEELEVGVDVDVTGAFVGGAEVGLPVLLGRKDGEDVGGAKVSDNLVGGDVGAKVLGFDVGVVQLPLPLLQPPDGAGGGVGVI
jgi:hypothetical protein